MTVFLVMLVVWSVVGMCVMIVTVTGDMETEPNNFETWKDITRQLIIWGPVVWLVLGLVMFGTWLRDDWLRYRQERGFDND